MRSQEHKSQILVVFSIRLGIKPVEVAPGKSGGGANGNRLDPTSEVQVDSSRLSQVDSQVCLSTTLVRKHLSALNYVSFASDYFLISSCPAKAKQHRWIYVLAKSCHRYRKCWRKLSIHQHNTETFLRLLTGKVMLILFISVQAASVSIQVNNI